MYDVVKLEKVWCPFCGNPMHGYEWQSKEGDCRLEVFTQTEFEKTIPDEQNYHLSGQCPTCAHWIDLPMLNEHYMDVRYPGWRPCKNCKRGGGGVHIDAICAKGYEKYQLGE